MLRKRHCLAICQLLQSGNDAAWSLCASMLATVLDSVNEIAEDDVEEMLKRMVPMLTDPTQTGSGTMYREGSMLASHRLRLCAAGYVGVGRAAVAVVGVMCW
jgi:hypothetical protein